MTDGERVRVVCAVVKNRMMTTKSNSMMAFTSVEDLTGTMEVIVFPKVLDTFRDAIRENAVVVIDGRLSVREDEASKLLADSIVPIDSYDPTRPQNGRPDPVKRRQSGCISVCVPQLPAVCQGDQSAGNL